MESISSVHAEGPNAQSKSKTRVSFIVGFVVGCFLIGNDEKKEIPNDNFHLTQFAKALYPDSVCPITVNRMKEIMPDLIKNKLGWNLLQSNNAAILINYKDPEEHYYYIYRNGEKWIQPIRIGICNTKIPSK